MTTRPKASTDVRSPQHGQLSTIDAQPSFRSSDGIPSAPYVHIATKECSGCGRWLPTSYFARNARDATGLQPWCKSCHRRYHQLKPKVQMPTVVEKRCSTCHQIKGHMAFNKDVSKPTGLRSQCNACRSDRRHARRSVRRTVLRRDSAERARRRETSVGAQGVAGSDAAAEESVTGGIGKCDGAGHVEVLSGRSGRCCRARGSGRRLAALLTVVDYESSRRVESGDFDVV